MMRYVFGDYSLDTEHYELHHGEKLVRLEPRVFNLLATLVQHPGHTLTKDELWAQVWPQLPILSDQSLKKCIEQARKALDDAGKAPQYIETVRGRGYRFIAAVDVRQGTEREAPRLPATPLPAAQPERGHADAGAAPAPLVPAPASIAPLMPAPVSLPEAATAETRGAVTQGPPEDEWRQLTVLVCHLGEVSGPAAPRDRDAREARLADVRDYQALCAEVVQRFEGHIAQYQVERLIVHFGYPRAHEDDARRAVHAGLGIVEGMAELNRRRKQERKHDSDVRLVVQVGIHTGLELIGAMAHGAQRPALAVGETVTIATGLQRHTEADTVLISPATWRLVEGYFVCEALGAQVLDDCAQPLAVYRVLQASTAQSRLDVAEIKGLTPFVGREQEVGLLGERWQQAREGMGQVVVLSGEAGIGKSRLVQVLKEAMAAEAYVRVESHCSPYYQHTALYPIVTSLQRLLQFRPDDPPEERLHKLERLLERSCVSLEEGVPLVAALLALPLPERYPPLQLTPQRQKQKTLELVLAWWLKEAERQPVCVIMEDLHWADASTLELLNLLIEQVPTAHMFLLLLCRPDFHPPWGFHSYLTQIALGRLSRRQVEIMVERITVGKALPTDLLQELVVKTDGVPLFVEELTKMVLESGLVKEREGQYVLVDPLLPLAIPDTLHDSLMARLDRLGPAKQVVQLGATLGREFSYDVLQAVSPLDEITLQHGLSQLVEAELLYHRGLPPQARYLFKHALIQEVAYHSMLHSTRRHHHRRIAQVLEARFPETCELHPELAAHHALRGEIWEKAVAYFRRAGTKAFSSSANREAIVCFEQALMALHHLSENRARTEQAIDLRFDLRNAFTALGEQERILDYLHEAATLAQTLNDQRRLGRVCGYMTAYFRLVGDYDRAIESGQRALDIATTLGDVTIQVTTNEPLGQVYHQLGDYHRAMDFLRWNMTFLGGELIHERFGMVGFPSVVSRAWITQCLAELGAFAEGSTRGEEAIRVAEEVKQPYSLIAAYYSAGVLYHRKGDFHKAIPLLERSLELCRITQITTWLPTTIAVLGSAYARSGRMTEALPLLEQAVEQTLSMKHKFGYSSRMTRLSEAYLLAGRIQEATQLASQALEVSRVQKERGNQAWALRLLGDIYSHRNPLEAEQAEAFYCAALALAAELKMVPLLAHCHLGLSILYNKIGRLEQAHTKWSAATEMYHAMEMAYWLSRAQAILA
jgi:DNA-binding winged helix-turn-helix (wHTH) protein/tetratricopeptide (TPR) repeat protein/class 3 adenylate cyclase/tRNA A37 threonylcarbamoyladenosine biosynthesis protein TsaE